MGDGSRYAERHDRLAGGTSELSPYCTSAASARASSRSGEAGAGGAFVRQLCWRDFYAHVLLHHPGNARHAFRREHRRTRWEDDDEAFPAWCEGRTGYPVGRRRDAPAARTRLDAQPRADGRRVVPDQGPARRLAARRGALHARLVDGDQASNNGDWQWVASAGADAAPYFRRSTTRRPEQRHDPDGEYVRRWVPELRDVPARALAEPWTMSAAEQEAAGCRIGRDYPEPIVDHARARGRDGALPGGARLR